MKTKNEKEAPSLGRMHFPGNPWPKGHPIAKFDWSARLEPDRGIFFEFDLRTADYSAESEGIEADDESDWKAPIVWNNYHSCHLHSDGTGFLAATAKKKLSLEGLAGRTFKIDTKAPEWDDAAFHVYLLGHDSVAGHVIAFGDRDRKSGAFALKWRGKICLSYVGRTEYDHRFEATLPAVSLSHIALPNGLTGRAARDALGQYVVDVDEFEIGKGGARPLNA